MVFNNNKIKRFVPEYKVSTYFAEGIQQTIDWFDNNPEYKKVDEKWNELMDKIIKENQ